MQLAGQKKSAAHIWLRPVMNWNDVDDLEELPELQFIDHVDSAGIFISVFPFNTE